MNDDSISSEKCPKCNGILSYRHTVENWHKGKITHKLFCVECGMYCKSCGYFEKEDFA